MWDVHSIDLSNAEKKIIDRLIRFFQNRKIHFHDASKNQKNAKTLQKIRKFVKKCFKNSFLMQKKNMPKKLNPNINFCNN